MSSYNCPQVYNPSPPSLIIKIDLTPKFISFYSEAGGCSSTRLLTGLTGVISSPNYPQNYGNNADCSWKITAPSGYEFVVLRFDSYKTESCSFDYVEVRNGDSPTSPLVKKVCGTRNSPLRVISNGPSMFVRFRSDGSVNYKGFRAVYTVARNAEGNITVDKARLVMNFPVSLLCVLVFYNSFLK